MKQATIDRLKAEYQSAKVQIKNQGYVIEQRTSLTWSFSKNGKRSVLGFDSECEVVNFIKENQPEADRIFPPYK